MTTSELLILIRDALAVDKTLEAWCIANLQSAPTIWLGIDPAKPPQESDYPIVCILGADQIRGDTKGEIVWELQIGVGVLNDDVTESGSKHTFEGLIDSISLREQVENAIYRARIAGVESSGTASEEWYYPLFVSYSTMEIRALKTSRRGLP